MTVKSQLLCHFISHQVCSLVLISICFFFFYNFRTVSRYNSIKYTINLDGIVLYKWSPLTTLLMSEWAVRNITIKRFLWMTNAITLPDRWNKHKHEEVLCFDVHTSDSLRGITEEERRSHSLANNRETQSQIIKGWDVHINLNELDLNHTYTVPHNAEPLSPWSVYLHSLC